MSRSRYFGFIFAPVLMLLTAQLVSAQVSISGFIKLSDQRPVMGVKMIGLPGEPVTDSSGFYTAHIARTPWSGRVTPTHTCYFFIPAFTDYANVTADQSQNYTASQFSYSISGNVGVAGATMNGLPGSPVSNASGNYTVTVPCGWSGTVTPTKNCYTFSPTTITYSGVTTDQTNQNYTGSMLTYTISGYVKTPGGSSIAGVAINGLPGSPSTDASGFYSVTVSCGFTGTATPALTHYSFSPPSITYTGVTSNQSNQNYTGKERTLLFFPYVAKMAF